MYKHKRELFLLTAVHIAALHLCPALHYREICKGHEVARYGKHVLLQVRNHGASPKTYCRQCHHLGEQEGFITLKLLSYQLGPMPLAATPAIYYSF